MYPDIFNKWFDWLMVWEGTTYENDPDDPGGATKFGIDQRTHADVDIKNLTREHAKQIYWSSYWCKNACDHLKPNVAEVVGNIAVNTGPGNAAKWLQTACGAKVDGSIGPKTIELANAMDPKVLGKALLDRTESYYRSIAKGRLSKFLKGWLNRNNDLRKFIGVN